jgi:hypothetical protein
MSDNRAAEKSLYAAESLRPDETGQILRRFFREME